MPAPPPVSAGQRYPVQIRDFVTYQNQPQDGTKIFLVQNSDGTTTTVDLTLDSAAVTKDLHTEIISLESVIGRKPFMVPGSTTVGRSIQWLYNFKATGHVDARNCIIPPGHYHRHFALRNLENDDHPQYMRRDGARPFTRPVTAPGAVDGDDLVNYSQVKPGGPLAGLNSAQVQALVNSDIASMHLAGEADIHGPDTRRWKMAGGVASGYTDINGNLSVDLRPAQFSGILSFIYCKMPFPGGSMLGWYAYQYMEDQLVLLGLSNTSALIQFIEDIRVDRQALVCMCWMALGL